MPVARLPDTGFCRQYLGQYTEAASGMIRTPLSCGPSSWEAKRQVRRMYRQRLMLRRKNGSDAVAA
ncbi:hypothetical protein GCM10010869_57410 [Mesorhizobium tianshanense]|uniref:Uncharacterized protein n=1 Tax=Mesorhizobium tianshanense TaxID=39844 RepID=A0A562NZA7_9HYPH|nr:hypothetical protein IQ26_02454 [Mesorhizobium tianshanense]GLS40144.1 hypothetical protein GCM10010869_57410 [Mesorhizobium tianshanense]